MNHSLLATLFVIVCALLARGAHPRALERSASVALALAVAIVLLQVLWGL